MKCNFRSNLSIKGRLPYFAWAETIALLGIVLANLTCVAQTRSVTLDDILKFDQVTEVELSPDGNRIAYIITCPGSKDAYGSLGEYSTLRLLDVRTRETRELTNGGFKIQDGLQALAIGEAKFSFIAQSITVPRWLPDSSAVAFISKRSGSSQIWLVDVSGGEPRQLTGQSAEAGSVQSSVQDFAISPDGRRIAYVTRTFKSNERDPENVKIVVVGGDSTVLKSTSGVQQIAIDVIDITSHKVERLMTGKTLYSFGWYQLLRWTPDASQLLYLPLPAADLITQSKMDLTLFSVKSKKVSVPAETPARKMIFHPDLSPNGTEVAFLTWAITDPERVGTVEVMSIRTGSIRRISGDYTNVWRRLPLVWQKATNIIYFAGRDKATVRVFALTPTGGPMRRVTPENFYVRDYSLSADGKRMAAIFENANVPPEIYIGNPNAGDFTRLTKLNPQLDKVRLGQVDKIQWRSKDNRFTVEGFLVKPPDYQPGKRYPLLVNLHGGPGALYENCFREVNVFGSAHTPPQLYAAAGYLVLLPNKRGDESYSPEFTRAHIKNWGRGDVNNDTEAGVDYLINHGIADPGRLGIMGHSYGAYAAAWAVTQTKRYKAASINDGFINLLSYYGQAYLNNNEFLNFHFGGNPTEQQALYIDRSPITWAGNITTPMMLRYGNARGPIRPQGIGLAQGLELYRALHERGVPVLLLIHPQEGHTIADLEVYRDYVERNLRWFNYWVLGKGTNPLEPGGK
jgi:dipeptidyl aminopeptidase/acylaminoacyl peptidase